MTVKVHAPAKINLSLHVTGQRADGYHLLDSLVAFAPVADRLIIQDGNTLSLTVEGPEAAGVPADMNNLVLRAAELLAKGRGAAITLEKNLPAASGIGGGSADAAAAIRGLIAHWQLGHLAEGTSDELEAVAKAVLELGADIPMCLMSQPARVSGIGEEIVPVSPLGPIPVLLINPRVSVSTPAVFRALPRKDNPPMPAELPQFAGVQDFTAWLADQRNDLQAPAIGIAPAIADVLQALEASEGCMLARMSGSGATCFGIYPSREAIVEAGQRLTADHPGWWLAGGYLGDQSKLAMPEVS